MNLEAIRIQLIRKRLSLKELAEMTGIDYDRLQKVIHGYRPPRDEETTVLAAALELPANDLM